MLLALTAERRWFFAGLTCGLSRGLRSREQSLRPGRDGKVGFRDVETPTLKRPGGPVARIFFRDVGRVQIGFKCRSLREVKSHGFMFQYTYPVKIVRIFNIGTISYRLSFEHKMIDNSPHNARLLDF